MGEIQIETPGGFETLVIAGDEPTTEELKLAQQQFYPQEEVSVQEEEVRGPTNSGEVESWGFRWRFGKADNRVGKAIEGPNNLSDDDNTRADISTESEIQQPKQSGYCYIGTDRTFRSCIKMNSGDTCISKQVFPTKDICINPSLRK